MPVIRAWHSNANAAPSDTPVARPGAPESGARQLQRVQRSWELPPGQPFTQADWNSAKTSALRALTAQRYPAGRLYNSLADVDTSDHSVRCITTSSEGTSATCLKYSGNNPQAT